MFLLLFTKLSLIFSFFIVVRVFRVFSSKYVSSLEWRGGRGGLCREIQPLLIYQTLMFKESFYQLEKLLLVERCNLHPKTVQQLHFSRQYTFSFSQGYEGLWRIHFLRVYTLEKLNFGKLTFGCLTLCAMLSSL